ncbi:aldo/keto reductase [Bacillus songklensis]|uniref:Aldo/keto reductase n=1 Tax=Bacillus songklensis TaxID=1069116 RepID=A0ABV8B354_9BACI
MEKRKIHRLNEEVTFVGFGALSIGRDWGMGKGFDKKRPNENEAGKLLHAVLDSGINLIDTASAYHRSEERIGKSISHRRNEYILASKCGEHNDEPGTYYDFSYNAVKQSIDRSLELLKTDMIDIMQIHFGPNPEKVIVDGETVKAMKDAKAEGKIRFLGASIDGELARHCINSGDFDIMQMEYNLLNQHNEGNIQLCKEKGIGVLIRTGLGRGLLTPKVLNYLEEDMPHKKQIQALLDLVNNDANLLSSIALQFLYQNDGISSVLIGTKNFERFEQNMILLDKEIDSSLLTKATEIVKS